MVSLYKYPPFSALSSFLLVADPPAKAAIDEIGIRISNKKTKVKKELNTNKIKFLYDFFINSIYSYLLERLDPRNYNYKVNYDKVKKSEFKTTQ